MTNERTNEPAKQRSEAANADGSAFVVFAILAANAATAFAIQAWMTYGFAKEVWKLPTSLCFALIVALDIFAIMYMVLTYLLRGTGWPRFAATVVFFAAIGAQVFAAELYGDHKVWATEVRWFAVFPAFALALSQEGAILWRTHRRDREVRELAARRKAALEAEARTVEGPVPPPATKDAPPALTTRATSETAKVVAPVRKEAGKTGKTQVKTPAPAKNDRQEEAVKLVLSGKRPADVAPQFGVSKRAVELWVKSYRERNPEPQTPPEQALRFFTARPAEPTETPRPINGAAPEVTVN
jgi:hypothetical protein